MLYIELVGVFYVKVINCDRELDVTCCLMPESWRVAVWEVSKPVMVIFNVVVRNLSVLVKVVNSLEDIDKEVYILNEW